MRILIVGAAETAGVRDHEEAILVAPSDRRDPPSEDPIESVAVTRLPIAATDREPRRGPFVAVGIAF